MCPDQETISAFYDNEVEQKFRLKLEKHVENCAECRKKIEKMEAASMFLKSGFDDIATSQGRVWDNIVNELDTKNIPDIWHRKINIPVPLLAAAAFLLITITALFSTLFYFAGRNDYNNFTVTEAVNLNNDYFHENDRAVHVEFQLPEEALFQISGSPKLIREVDYLKTND